MHFFFVPYKNWVVYLYTVTYLSICILCDGLTPYAPKARVQVEYLTHTFLNKHVLPAKPKGP